MKLFKNYTALIFILISFLLLNAQVINPERGDGFWSLVNPIRLNQIIWLNDTLYASRNPLYQSNGGVYRSIDGGVSWDTLYSVSDVLSSGLRLFIHPANHKILYMIYGALYRSTNSGQSWQTIFASFGPLVRLGINPQNPNIMYVTKSIPYGAVFKTTDAGLTWNDASNGLPSEEYFQAGPIEVNLEFPDTILLGTNTGLYRSTNGGINWDTTQVKGFIGSLFLHPLNSAVYFAGTTSTLQSKDFGISWVIVDSTFIVDNLAFNKNNQQIIYSNDNFKSTDLGGTWHLIDSNFAYAFSDITIDSVSLSNLYSCNHYGVFSFRDILLSSEKDISSTNLKYVTTNFPNPFNNSTTIKCNLKQNANLTLHIYNALGQKIKTLVNQTELSPGEHTYNWNGQDDYQSNVASGFYLCLIIIEYKEQKEVQSLKLLLLK